MFSLLFFDDWNLQRRVNLRRHIGSPTLVPEGTIEDPHVDSASGYPSVLRNPQTQRWRCYYQGKSPRAQKRPVALLAESDDGVHWELPDLSGRLDIPGRVCPHQLFDSDDEWCSVFEDGRAATADERFKALSGSVVLVSSDGLSWRPRQSMRWSSLGADPAYYAFWNQYRNTYVITMRPRVGDRRIALSETSDWRSFTEPEWAMQADALDSPCALIYGMPVFPYEHIFIGLVWVFHTDPVIDVHEKYIGRFADTPSVRPNDEHARVMGKIDCQLAYSLNGWHFQRTLRDPFIANGAPGEHGSGCVYPSSMVVDGDTIRIYSIASRGEHALVLADTENRQGAILLHTLRRDGFVYLEPAGGTGELITRPLVWEGGELQLNVGVPRGQALVQIMDRDGRPIEGYRYEDSLPFTGDSLDWTPRWLQDRKLDTLRDRILRIGVRLSNGRLYAVRGSFKFKTFLEATAYMQSGERSAPMPGF